MNILNSPRLRERRQGLDLFNEIIKDKSKSLLIHYSCESFITSHGNTPRVTSICIKSLSTGQTISFSIHLQAQFEGLDFKNLSDSEYDRVELSMLSEFSKYVKTHTNYKWIHWNMRDSNYGFEAINNRIRILHGEIFDIGDDRKYDFPRILGLLYTYDYEKNRPKGRLLNLAERNSFGTINALTGAEEATAFDNKEYLKLHMSTLKKVDVIESIVHATEMGHLKVNSSKKFIYGLTFAGFFALVKETPWLLVIFTIIGYLLNIIVEPIVKAAFHID
ncbi:hypothetical protein LLH06_00705 [Mucilaginibacter daejeonensis]|uniref:hypothetical protein n=1 Tax=Mucilaginibacter daejeonensis TaxID=398049 RepID=UPI001D170C66|nr:hypothetical protein [Mucilaginibacter daejeonensis]UEG53496.1 hypothetical protein LLH06_00705 [Mucilaginibacter daejeonensis]